MDEARSSLTSSDADNKKDKDDVAGATEASDVPPAYVPPQTNDEDSSLSERARLNIGSDAVRLYKCS